MTRALNSLGLQKELEMASREFEHDSDILFGVDYGPGLRQFRMKKVREAYSPQ